MNLGEKIKQLRKARKMTLVQVAGDKLSKGMLSLIENGKAQPSMESLQHIAKQLGIDVSELMQTGEVNEIRELYKQVEQLRLAVNNEYVKEKYMQLFQNILDLIEPYVLQGKLKGQTFEEVSLYETYVVMRNRLKIDESMDVYYDIIEMYEKVHAYSKILNVYSRLASFEFEKRAYEAALDVLFEAEKYVDNYDHLIGVLEKLDLYYNITVMYAAINENEKAENYLEMALTIAKEKKVIYRLNDFYRFLFVSYCEEGNVEKANYYLDKIRAMTSILEDPFELFIEQLLTLFYINLIEKDYEKTIATTFDQSFVSNEFYEESKHFFHGEYGYAYWKLGRFEEALEQLQHIRIPEQNQHPIDLVRLYRSYAIRALCYFEIGDIENAKRDILYAVDGVKDLKDLYDKKFIQEAFKKIM